MSQQRCTIFDHQEPIIGICLSDVCDSKAISCFQCFKQFHSQHQRECKTFKILSNQLIEYQKAYQEFIEKVKDCKLKFDELYQKFLNRSQEYFEQLNSINQLMKEKYYYPTDSDIDFLKNYYTKRELNQESYLINQLYLIIEYLQKQDLDQFTFELQNQKIHTEQDQTDNQSINLKQETIDVMFQQGIDLFKNNHFQQSFDVFENLLKVEKSNQQAIYWKIQCLMHMKKYSDVVVDCDRIIKDDSQFYEISLKEIETLIKHQRYDQAIEIIEKEYPRGVFSLFQQHIHLFNYENMNLQDSLNIKKIINIINQIIHENLSKSKQSLFNLFEVLSDSQISLIKEINQTQNKNELNDLPDNKKEQKSNEIIEQTQFETTLNSTLEQDNQVNFNYQFGKYIGIPLQKDLQSYQKLNLQDNKSPHEEFLNAHLYQGDILIKSENYKEAIKLFDKIIERDSNNWIAHKNKAQCLNLLELHEEAIQFSNLAIQIDSQRFGSYLIRGSSQLKLNRYEEAIESFQTVINLDKTQHKAYALNGVALHNLGRFKEAITQFDIALFIFQDVSYLIKKADSLFEIEKYSEAITAYEDALLAGTTDTDYIYEKLKSIQIN
ncbi:unnamed protein product [Paramecium pentaurelia]|uniref:Tetratricopeptide repeat protein n=1 Tax=Paramecium pentaurelia TaxID=43138 RepID=A0A8S1WW72_9CILI|nr:unnamed protein product [Paramecium pentaurelia]